MKKIISIFLIISLFLSISLPVCAESKLAQFEQLLVGEWRQVEIFSFSKAGLHNFTYIGQFQYPAPETAYTVDTENFIPKDEFVNVIYDAYLTEDATGQIYLVIQFLTKLGWGNVNIGSVSFSEDGNRLVIIPPYSDGACIYERIN